MAMRIAPFATEQFYALYEFNTPHLLSVSDCETITIAELLALSGRSLDDLGRLKLGYTESQGDPGLRAAIAATYENLTPEDIIILTSPEEGVYLTTRNFLEPDDEVIVLTPAYDSLLNLAQHISGNVKTWPLNPTETGWELDLDRLETITSPSTKLIVVNFPHNPTGFLPTGEQLSAVIEIAQKHGTWLLCDEMYRGLELVGRPTLPSAADLYERAIVLSGLSKSYGLPGLRSGWLAVTDKAARHALINWKFYTSICPPAPSEFLALAALEARQTLVNRSLTLVEKHVALAADFFAQHTSFFHWRAPQGSSVSLAELNIPSALDYCHRLAKEAGILLLPGVCLGANDRTVRFGFGRSSFPQDLAAYNKVINTGHLAEI
ncbi:MAG: pyridoxal phosphate-dependent aminotransferase [Candidatus Promineifilaceae bacterium]